MRHLTVVQLFCKMKFNKVEISLVVVQYSFSLIELPSLPNSKQHFSANTHD
jgi:predicted amino acid-binding ACT domain protein